MLSVTKSGMKNLEDQPANVSIHEKDAPLV